MDREHRLRIQAELQNLITELQHQRQREAEHLKSVSGVPQFTKDKIHKLRRRIIQLEDELQAGKKSPAQQWYREGFAAELRGDAKKAIKLYKQAARKKYPDADAALYCMKCYANTNKKSWLIGAAILLVVVLAAFVAWQFSTTPSETPAVKQITFTPLASAPAAKIATRTPTSPPPTNTPRPTASSTPAPIAPTPAPPLTATEVVQPLATPTETPTLQPAPKLIGPPDNLVWQGGAVVFEFEAMDLNNGELYCLDALRGFDRSGAENWSYPPRASKTPAIPVDANVFSVAKTQGMQCVTWQAYIGQTTCQTRTSNLTTRRVIGLPDPCPEK